MSNLEWHHKWTTYEGEVRIILDDGSVAYGAATGHHHTETDCPLMQVAINSEAIWIHPQFVWPSDD